MSDEQTETGDLTERFRAFAQEVDPQPSRTLPVAMMIGIGAGVVIIVAAVIALLTL
jgi:hypothetical protein